MYCSAHAEARARVWTLLADVPPLEPEDVIGFAAFDAHRFPVGYNRPPTLGTNGTLARAFAQGLMRVAEAAPEVLMAAGLLSWPVEWTACPALTAEPIPRLPSADFERAMARLIEWHRTVITPLARWNDNEALAASTGRPVETAVREQFERLPQRMQHIVMWQHRLAQAHPHRLMIVPRHLERAIGRAARKIRVAFAPSGGDLTEFEARVLAEADPRTVFVSRDGRLLLNQRSVAVERVARDLIREKRLPREHSLDVPTTTESETGLVSVHADTRATDPTVVVAEIERLPRFLRFVRDLVECQRVSPVLAATRIWALAEELRRRVRDAAGRSRRERKADWIALWAAIREGVPGLPAMTGQADVAAHFGVGRMALRARLADARQFVAAGLARAS